MIENNDNSNTPDSPSELDKFWIENRFSELSKRHRNLLAKYKKITERRQKGDYTDGKSE